MENNTLDILKRANALYTRYDPKLPMQRATKVVKQKYENIIQPKLGIPRARSSPNIQTRFTSRNLGNQMALMNLNKSPIESRYFDDFNEIVDRLKLLLASQSVGNNSRNNEIIFIVEELREASIN